MSKAAAQRQRLTDWSVEKIEAADSVEAAYGIMRTMQRKGAYTADTEAAFRVAKRKLAPVEEIA